MKIRKAFKHIFSVLSLFLAITVAQAQPVINNVIIAAGDYKVGDDIAITIQADGPGYTLDPGTKVNGKSLNSFNDDGGGNYSAIYTVSEGDTDRASVSAIPVSIILDDAGTTNTPYTTAPTSSGTVTIDANTPAAPAGLDLDAADDSGSSNTDNITNVTNNLTISGTAEANADIEIFIDGSGGSTTTASGTGTWSIDINLTEGNRVITAKATDAAGNTSAASTALNITVDTTAPGKPTLPDLAAADDSGISNTDNITNKTSALSISGNAENGSTVELFNGTTSQGTTLTTGSFWSFDISASEGTHSITAVATDVAGNVGPASDALTLVIDITSPSFTGVTASPASGTLKVGDVVNVTLTAAGSEAGINTTGAITVNNIDVSSSFSDDGGGSYSLTYTIAEGHTDQVANNLPIYVPMQDDAGNTVTINSFTGTTPAIDANTPIAPSPPDLDPASDSGSSSSDNITNISSGLIFNGTAEANATVQLFVNGTADATGTADGGGNWSISTNLPEGTHTITAKATDPAGNTSPASGGLNVTIDTTAPGAPSLPDLAAADDSGISNSDNLTNKTSALTISGVVESGSTVELFNGAASQGTTLASSGSWSFDISAAEGVHNITAVATDVAGNTGAASAALTLTIDTTAPSFTAVTASPATGTLKVGDAINVTLTAAGSEQGIKTNGILTINSIDVSGTYNDNLDGTYSLGYIIAEGHTDQAANNLPISVPLQDDAGNTVTINSFTGSTPAIDANSPAAPSTPDLNALDDSGISNTDNVTNITTGLTFEGTAEANAAVQLFIDGVGSTTGTADGAGNWSIDLNLTEGTYAISAKTSDAAGNTSPASGTLTITIDTTPPNALSIAIADATNPWSTSNGVTKTSAQLDLSFTITFDGTVYGVDLPGSDFQVVPEADVDGGDAYPPVTYASLSVASGSGATRTVTVNDITGSGRFRIDFIDDNTVTDLAGNPAGGNALNDGDLITSFTGNQYYTVALDQPSDNVTITAANVLSTNEIQLNWTNPAAPAVAPTHLLIIVKGEDINDLPGTYPSVADGAYVADDLDFNDGQGAINIDLINNPGTATYTFNTLLSGKTYDFEILSYSKSPNPATNNDNIDYLGRNGSTDTGGVPTIQATTPTAQEGTITAGTSTEPATLSSIMTSFGSEVVLDFTITDDGTNPGADNAKIKFTDMIIRAGAGNTVTDWSEVIEEVELTDITDNNTITVSNTAIGTNTITFSGLDNGSDKIAEIDDNEAKEYRLKIRFKNPMTGSAPDNIDGQRFEFVINASDFTYKNASSSTIAASESETSDPGGAGTNNEVTVVATQLDFTVNPDPTALVLANLTTTPVLRATDANGNTDLDFNNTVNVANTDGIPMLNLEPGDLITAANGVITFPANFQYQGTGNGTLLVSATGLTSPASPTTVTVTYATGNTITAGALSEPASLSSLLNTSPGQAVFDFLITDDGGNGGDGSPTRITDLKITQGTGNSIANWTEAIAGATLSDGTNTLTGTINATDIAFNAIPVTVGAAGFIDDDLGKTYTLNIWLKSTLGGSLPATIDGQNFVFELNDDAANITLGAGSGFTGTENTNSGGTNNQVDVSATQLSFTTQPPATAFVNASLTISPVVEALDANNNRDLDYNAPLTITNNKSLGMANEPTTIASGIASFPTSFVYTDLGDGSAGNGTLSAVTTGAAALPSVTSTAVTVRLAATTLITAGAGTEPTSFSSTNTAPDGSFVFDFAIEDDGGSENDGNPTLISSISITQGATYNDGALSDWTQVIEGAVLIDDEAIPNTITGTVNATSIDFTGLPVASGQLGYVGDDNTKTYSLKIWLKDSIDFRISGFTLPLPSYTEPVVMVDNKQLEFLIDEINITTATNSSGIQSGEQVASGNANSITVDATNLDFTIEPPSTATINTIYNTRVEARDVHANRDTDFNNSLDADVTNLGGLGMLNAPLSTDSFTAGKLDFDPAFQYTTAGASPAGQLVIQANGITGNSSPRNVIASADSYITADNTGLIPTIDAFKYDATDIQNDGVADIEIARFILHDGRSPLNGGTDDTDGAATIVTDLDISIIGFANLRRVALYAEDLDINGDGTGTFTEVDEQNAAAVINFEDLTTGLFKAEDNKTRQFIIVVSFLDTYTDNDPLRVTINNVEARIGGSQFNLAEPLPATDPARNLVVINATQLDFGTGPLAMGPIQGVNTPVTPVVPTVFANDAKGNLDTDFNYPAAIGSGGATMVNVPTAFGISRPGILDFPGFMYSGAGDGTLTVKAEGLIGVSNPVDVIHTTFTTLDLGSNITDNNNGIEAGPSLYAGDVNKAIIGFRISAVQNTPSEPKLVGLTIRFGDLIAGSLSNIRLVSSTDSKYNAPETLVSNNTIVGLDNVSFQNILVDITATDLYYFVIADIVPTANFTNPVISPSLNASDIIITNGSLDASISGRSYQFVDPNPPVVDNLVPANGDDNFPQNGTISITFNEAVTPIDNIIRVYSLAADTLVSVLTIESSSPDEKTFYFNPNTPVSGSPLEGDTDYYILVPAGDKVTTGFVDKSNNAFEGITTSDKWVFKTTDNIAPYFTSDLPNPTLPASAENIIDKVFDLRIALNEAGKIYYIVVDPDLTTGTPTVTDIRSGTYPGTLTSGTADILRGFEYHYVSIYNAGFPTPGNKFRVWVTAEDAATPPNQMVDGDPNHPGTLSVDGVFGANPPAGIIVQNTPSNTPVDICIGEPQIVFTPINFVEGNNNDFSGSNQKINMVITGDFEYNTGSTVSVTTQGGDISNLAASFFNKTVLTITFDANNTSNRDKIIISGLELVALNGVGSMGEIQSLGSTVFADGTTLLSMNTTQIDPVKFITDPNTTSIGDIHEEIPLIPVGLTPLDKGTKAFSGPGVFGDTLYVAAAGLGTHTITFNYTNEVGCTSEYSLSRTIFDNDRAIVGLSSAYCTNDELVDIIANSRQDYTLIDLKVEVAPNQPEEIMLRDSTDIFNVDGIGGVGISLDKVVSDYKFYPSRFSNQANYDYFTNLVNETNEGGLIGELLFTGIYQSDININQRDTLEQRVKVYFSPTSEIKIGTSGPYGDTVFDPNNIPPSNTVPLELEICENAGDIPLFGSSPNGYFAITVEVPDPNSPSSPIIIRDATDFPGLIDNGDGTGWLNPQIMVDSSDFSFGELELKFIVENPVGGCADEVSQTIRISPTPVAQYIVPALLCEDTELTFESINGYDPADSVLIANGGFNNAYFPAISSFDWNFDDDNSGPDNTPSGDLVTHNFADPGNYDVSLTVTNEFGCKADSIVALVVGGLPDASFDFSGLSLNDTLKFESTSTVFSSTALVHAVDSVAWDVNGDDINDFGNNDNDPLNDNSTVFSYAGSNFSNPGIYDVRFTATSTVGCSTTITRKLGVLANEQIVHADSTYFENFDSGTGNWLPLDEIDANNEFTDPVSWAWGNVIAPASATAWATNPAGAYNSAERSYVYSPVFDFEKLSRPMVQVDVFKDFEDQDGVIIEYSTDSLNIADPAKNWKTLGVLNGGINWYNGIGLAGSPGNDVTGLGWSGTGSEWQTAKYDLSEVSGSDPTLKTRVVFRFGLGAITSHKTRQGFAFDNLYIGNRNRTVLVENFTSMAGDSQNKVQNDTIRAIANNMVDANLVYINYHTATDGTDVLNADNPADPAARSLYYGIDKTPRVSIDGTTSLDITGNPDLLFTEWGTTYYSQQILQIAPMIIKLDATNSNGKLAIEAKLYATTSEITDDFTVHVVILEDSVSLIDLGSPPVATGEEHFYNTIRKMLPDAGGTKYSNGLAKGDSIILNLEWEPYDYLNPGVTDIDPARFSVLVFVQNEATKAVYQARQIRLDNLGQDLVLGVEDELDKHAIALYPNPADNSLTLELLNVPDSESTGIIFDNTGRKIEELQFFPGQTRYEINTTNYQPGIYMMVLPDNEGTVSKRFIISH